MRPVRPWRLEPTLRYLAMLPLGVAVAGLGIELAARAAYGSIPANQRPVWLLAVGTGVIHLLALILLRPLLHAHAMGVRDAFGLFAHGWLRRWGAATLLTVPAIVSAWLLHRGSGWMLDLLSIPHESQEAVEAVRAAGRGWERFLLLGFAAGSAPVVEEILFRGILWPAVRDWGWPRLGALAVSMAFALIHLNASAFLPLCGLGLFWIWLYERTGDLSACMLSHSLFNGLNVAWILMLPAPPQP